MQFLNVHSDNGHSLSLNSQDEVGEHLIRHELQNSAIIESYYFSQKIKSTKTSSLKTLSEIEIDDSSPSHDQI